MGTSVTVFVALRSHFQRFAVLISDYPSDLTARLDDGEVEVGASCLLLQISQLEMADSTTAYPPPSPAPTLPTPHAPGFFPETPAEGAYRHDEGPLDAAGRALTRDTTGDKGTLGGALLGVGVGALFGGPLGALVGGSVGGIAGLEEQGIRSKFGNSPAGQQQVTEERTAAALQQSPAQRLVGNDDDGSVSALLAGGAGAHVVDQELDEPAADQVDPGTLSGLPVADESIVDMVNLAFQLESTVDELTARFAVSHRTQPVHPRRGEGRRWIHWQP